MLSALFLKTRILQPQGSVFFLKTWSEKVLLRHGRIGSELLGKDVRLAGFSLPVGGDGYYVWLCAYSLYIVMKSLSDISRAILLIVGGTVEFINGMQFFKTSIGSIPSLSYVLKMGFGAVNSRSISDFIPRGVSISPPLRDSFWLCHPHSQMHP